MTTSVVITSYNCVGYIERAIKSVFEQELKTEVIVVDDCSTDGTWELLNKLAKDGSFKLLRTEHNSGPSAVRNLGIKDATGDYINFLDGDDYLLSDKLSKEIGLLQDNSEAVGVFCDSKLEKLDGISSVTLKQVSLIPQPGEDFLAHLLKTNCIALHAALIKTSAAKKVMFDESLRRAEDYDFWLRITMEYGPLLYLDEPLVVYRKIKGGLSSQVIKTINDNIIVLDKISPSSLNDLQLANLKSQKDGLFRTAAHLKLRSFDNEGFEYLEHASKLSLLPRSQQLVLSISRRSKLLAVLIYNMISAGLYIRRIPSLFDSRTKIVREFNR